jgi:hypothetical protein
MSVKESENPIHAAALEAAEAARVTNESIERESVFQKATNKQGGIARQPSIAYLESLKKKKELVAKKPRRDSNDHFSLKKRLEAMEIHGKFKKRYLCAAIFALLLSAFLFTIAGIIADSEQQAQANILFILGAVMIIVSGYYMYQFLGRLYQW